MVTEVAQTMHIFTKMSDKKLPAVYKYLVGGWLIALRPIVSVVAVYILSR